MDDDNDYVITSDVEPDDRPPMDLVAAIWEGRGGTIRIEPGARPAKIMWALKNILRSVAIGFQWNNVKKLVSQGMHHERAEAHVTDILQKLTVVEIPPIPSRSELDAIEARVKERDGENRSDDPVSE
jgi:hypothetical protein